MTYAYDDYIQMPTKDLYDTAVMKMAIDAAKDMYDKGQAQMENFYKTYGDFMSPFAKDMQKYGEAMNYVRDTVNDAYARGIDLARSPEGRAMIQRLTHSVNPLWYNSARQQAKMGYAYLDAIQKARENGTYDADAEAYALKEAGLPSFGDFSTEEALSGKYGFWNRPAPVKYQDVNAMVSPLFEDMKDEYIDSDGQYDYSGVSRDRRALVLQANLGALLRTPMGKYHYELSKQKANQIAMATEGREATEQEILSQYQDDLLDASDRFEHRTRTENKDWARQRESQLRREEDVARTDNDIRADKAKMWNQYDVQTHELMDTNRDKQISKEERENYTQVGSSTDKSPSILADSAKKPGTSISYNPADPYKAKVDPVDGRIEFHAESKKDAGDAFYTIPNDVASSVLFRYEDGHFVPMDRGEMNSEVPWYKPWSGDGAWYEPYADAGQDQVVFVPSGSVITLTDDNGNKHQFMFGTINANGEQCLMRVQSRKYNYNK